MLIDRVNRIASDRGLTILDVDAVVIGLADAGLRTLHHESESNSEIADRLYQVRGKRDDLFVSRAQALPPGVDEKFAAWLGPSRLKNWPTLNPIARGGLRRKFDAGTPAKQGIEAELIVRYDSLEAAQTRMTARKRLALAFERGADKQPATVKIGALPSSARGLHGEKKLEAYYAQRELAKIEHDLAGLRASNSGGLNVGMARTSAIERLEARAQALRNRWGSARHEPLWIAGTSGGRR